MRKVELLLQTDFHHNPFGLAWRGDSGCGFYQDERYTKVKYKRFHSYIQRLEDGVCTHTIRAKIPAHRWNKMILEIEAWARTGSMDDSATRLQELLDQMDEQEYGADFHKLMKELETDRNDWDTWRRAGKGLIFSDSVDDFCEYIWYPDRIERIEDAIVKTFLVTIPADQWKIAVDIFEDNIP